jgi:hypothetical protein
MLCWRRACSEAHPSEHDIILQMANFLTASTPLACTCMDFVTDTNFHSDVSERIRIKGQVSRDGHVSNQTTRLIFNKCQKNSGDPVEVECMQDADLAF